MNLYKLAPTLTCQMSNQELILGKGTKQKIINELPFINEILTFLENFGKQELTLAEITRLLSSMRFLDFNFLVENNFLIDANFNLNTDFSRNELFWNYKFNDMHFITRHLDRQIVIWGCGGIGSAMAFALASLGFKNLLLLDKDHIEKTNLNRQFLFTKKDLNQPKILILKRELEARFDDLKIKLCDTNDPQYFQNLLNKDLLNSQSLIILAADENICLKQATEISLTKLIPVLNVGYLHDISVIGPFYIPTWKDSACFLCAEELTLDQVSSSTALLGKAPSWIGNNSLAVIMALREVICYLRDDFSALQTLNKRFGVDLFSGKHYFLAIQKNSTCPWHLQATTPVANFHH